MKSSEMIAYHMYKDGAAQFKELYSNLIWGYAAAGGGAVTSFVQSNFGNDEGSLYANLSGAAILLATMVSRHFVNKSIGNAPRREKELEAKVIEEFGEIPKELFD